MYSGGVGSAVFNPVVEGKVQHAIEFTCVLHVPSLCNNLISVLFLCKHKRFEVCIAGSLLTLSLYSSTLFTAHIDNNNAAYLDGITLTSTEYANATACLSTIPLDESEILLVCTI